jgi:trans-aconitate 2-methyltransferase
MSQAASPSQRWDPRQYERFRDERARPFFDLVGRVPDGPVRRVADLGCGTGELTRTLLDRWPQASVWGVDSSPEMLARAAEAPASPRLHFVRADLAAWEPEAPLDRVVSNAALQWLPDHGPLLGRLAGLLAPGGALAVQIPYHDRREGVFHELDQLVLEAPWRERLHAAARRPSIETPAFYAEHLLGLGLEIEMWETVYHHRMESASGIVEWVKGTALRPLLAALAPPEQAEFLDALLARVARIHPGGPHGIFFPFRRLFFVACRP